MGKKAKKARFAGKSKNKQIKVYIIEIKMIQNVFIYIRINFLTKETFPTISEPYL